MCSILETSLFNLCLPHVDIRDKTVSTRSCVVKSITSILGFTPQHHCSSIGFFISLTPLSAGSRSLRLSLKLPEWNQGG